MVVEYIRYTVPAAAAAEFMAAYQKAGRFLDADPHCAAYEVARGVEEPGNFVVRIEWDSIEGHERGFRSSPAFGEFFAAVRPFFADIAEMKHYQVQYGGGRADVQTPSGDKGQRPSDGDARS